MVPRSLMIGLASLGLIALPTTLTAQLRASERGQVSQTVDGTTISLDYGRPQVRGRENLFGGVVHWGEIWTPGANWATTIEVSNSITINGHSLAKGKYSMWLQVQEEGWTAIFDPQPRRFHLMPPPEADNQVRFAVTPEPGEHVEMLTFSFPAVKPTGATLQLAWSTTTVSFDIGVQPSRDLTIAADFAERYVGSYDMTLRPPLGTNTVPFVIRYENERLVATWESGPSARLKEFWMISLGEGMFAPGELDDGELFDIVMDVIFEFRPYEGNARGFELRALGDAVWASAERKP